MEVKPMDYAPMRAYVDNVIARNKRDRRSVLEEQIASAKRHYEGLLDKLAALDTAGDNSAM